MLDQLKHCRARRQVLILDSCFSGAFAHGAKGEADLGLRDRFLGQGRGRIVLTASTATEYSFEGDPTDAAVPAGSVFTAALVQGLRTGAADTDRDGHVSVDDAYAYVFNHVQAVGAAQTPQRWLYGAEGKILLARSPAGPAVISAPLPESLRTGLDNPHPGIRIGAVTELGDWLTSGDPARAAAARQRLQDIASSDIPRVAVVARALLDTKTAAKPPALATSAPASPAPAPPLHLARTLTGHAGWVRSVAFSPDGRLATASTDKTARLWDPANGDCLGTCPVMLPGFAVSRSARTDDCWPRLAPTGRRGYGIRLAVTVCAPWPVTPNRSTTWRSARTGGCWPPPARTTRCGCGIQPPVIACAA